jgi:uncharacterized protein YegJ (DUF2314 family)
MWDSFGVVGANQSFLLHLPSMSATFIYLTVGGNVPLDNLSFMTNWLYVIISLSFLVTNCSTKQKFARKDDEPLFANLDSDELNYTETVKKAKSEISLFQQELIVKPETSTACVKILIPDNQEKGAFIWLVNPTFELDTCVAEIFEIPNEFEDFRVGDKLKFHKEDIQDWYILDKDGRMKGGYSLRYMRLKLSEKEQIEFDKYIGVKVYL